jgi:hypothetical protein
MRVKYLIFVLAICMLCFLLPFHAGTAEEEGGACPKPYITSISPPWAAKPGDLIKIQGGRFGLERGEVIFTEGGTFPLELIFAPQVKAEILSWTFHRIWVIVPKSAASGPVFVRVPCGSASNKKDFTVNK